MLDQRLLNEEQKGVARSIQSHLHALGLASQNLTAAISLYQACRPRMQAGELYGQWVSLAGRSGAMDIRNYGLSIAKVRSLIGQIPLWLKEVDIQALKGAEKDFRNFFPNADKLRHSVAHPELYSDGTKDMSGRVESPLIHAPNGEPGTLVFNGCFFEDTFTSTFEGTAVSYDLTHETVIKVVDITSRAFLAFAKLDPFHEHRSRMQGQ